MKQKLKNILNKIVDVIGYIIVIAFLLAALIGLFLLERIRFVFCILLVVGLLQSCQLLKTGQKSSVKQDSVHVQHLDYERIIDKVIKGQVVHSQGFTSEDVTKILALMKAHKDTVVKIQTQGGGVMQIHTLPSGLAQIDSRGLDSLHQAIRGYRNQVDELHKTLQTKEKQTEIKAGLSTLEWVLIGIIALIVFGSLIIFTPFKPKT